ncbi:hypothetical protein HDU76_000715, partial [Blyttiomyces sp. JEL0837]
MNTTTNNNNTNDNTVSSKIQTLPFEIVDEIAVLLQPRMIKRLSLTCKCFRLRLGDRSDFFAKRYLLVHLYPMLQNDNDNNSRLDPILNNDNRNKLDTILNNPSLLSTTFLNDIRMLGDHYQAACIGILGIELSVKLFLGHHYTSEVFRFYKRKDLKMPRDGEWFDQTMPDAQHFSKLVSIAALAGDIDLEACDFTALFYLAAMGDWDTLVKLYQMKLLPVNSHHRILCEAIYHDQDEVALWVLSFEIVDPSLDNNKALFAAIENGRKAVVQKLLNDQRVVETFDWYAAMVAVIESSWGNDIDLLNLIYRPKPVNQFHESMLNHDNWGTEQESTVTWTNIVVDPHKWHTESQYVFEIITRDLDYSSTQLTPIKIYSLFQNAIRSASRQSVVKFVEFGWLKVVKGIKPVSGLLRVAAVFERWEILDYLLGFKEVEVPEP